MYCPKCAATHPDDSKFCRACGLDLEVISHVLEMPNFKGVLDRAKKRKKRLRNIGSLVILLSFIVGALIPIAIGLGFGNLNSPIMILAGIAGIMLFSGISLTVLAEIEPKETNFAEMASPNALSDADKNQLGPADSFEPALSVVEEETRGLDTNKIKIPRNHDQ